MGEEFRLDINDKLTNVFNHITSVWEHVSDIRRRSSQTEDRIIVLEDKIAELIHTTTNAKAEVGMLHGKLQGQKRKFEEYLEASRVPSTKVVHKLMEQTGDDFDTCKTFLIDLGTTGASNGTTED